MIKLCAILCVYFIATTSAAKVDLNKIVSVGFSTVRNLIPVSNGARINLAKLEVSDYNELYPIIATVAQNLENASKKAAIEVTNFKNVLLLQPDEFSKSAIVMNVPNKNLKNIINGFRELAFRYNDIGNSPLADQLKMANSALFPNNNQFVVQFDTANDIVASFIQLAQDLTKIGKLYVNIGGNVSSIASSINSGKTIIPYFIHFASNYLDNLGKVFTNMGNDTFDLSERINNMPCALFEANSAVNCKINTSDAYNAFKKPVPEIEQKIVDILYWLQDAQKKLASMQLGA